MKFRRFLKSVAVPGVFGILAAFPSSTSLAQESLVTSVSTFQIPFDVESSPGEPVEGFAVLFGSRNGSAWEKLQTVSASEGGFQFSAPGDGTYGFAVRMMDAQGNLQPVAGAMTAELEVKVDTSAPSLQLEASEIAPGQVMAGWKCSDPHLDLRTLAMEYSEGRDGRWKPVRLNPAPQGQTVIQVLPGAVVSIRGTISDAAGNRAEESSQVVLNAMPRNSGVPATPAPAVPAPAQAMGLSPFQQTTPSSAAVPGVPGQGFPGSSSVTSVSGGPVAQSFGGPGAVGSGFGVGPGANFPAGASQVSSDDGPAFVNTSVFDISYEIEVVGPSGVGAVELFVTEDGGRQWFRYGTDPDLQSPFAVDVQGEGTFGFAVRVKNGLGFSDPPPQPGEIPTIVVTVDQSAPQIEFPQPSLTAEGNGVVVLNWKVRESNLAGNPVRLEYSTAPNGPWTPVTDWQPDTGSTQWAVRPGTPPAVYFRLLARDVAGNVGTGQPPQPVLIDMKRPSVRGLRVQSSSTGGGMNAMPAGFSR